MEVAVIAPGGSIELAELGGIQMMLPDQLTSDKAYAAYYSKKLGFKMLDNGAAEGEQYPVEKLFYLADCYGATEIVVPDVMGNALDTIAAAYDFQEAARFNPEYMYAAVIHGRTDEERDWCLDFYEEQPWITTVCLPRIMNKSDSSARLRYARTRRGRLKAFSGGVHCLGSSYPNAEVSSLTKLDYLRSIDTCLPIAAAFAGTRIWPNEFIPRQEDYFELLMDTYTYELARRNIATYLDWAKESTLASSEEPAV